MTLIEALHWAQRHHATIEFRPGDPAAGRHRIAHRPHVRAACPGCSPVIGRSLMTAVSKLRRFHEAAAIRGRPTP
jgi:hypothetical protein